MLRFSILDPPRPPDEGEVARQLLLRNRFATDLVLMGQHAPFFAADCSTAVQPNWPLCALPRRSA